MCKDNVFIGSIEKRFCEVTNIDIDLSIEQIFDKSIYQKTSKKESEEYGFVTTPLYLVDEMIYSIIKHENMYQGRTYLDLCSGCGQFSIRLLRILWYKYKRDNKNNNRNNSNFNLGKFLNEKLYFSEINPESVAKLFYIFGNKINIFIGDSCFLNKSPKFCQGSMFYNKESKMWKNDKEFDNEIQNVINMKSIKCIPLITEIVKKYIKKNYESSIQIELEF